MKYDDPNYHWNNDFPASAAEDNALTHMGFFFSWALSHDLINDFHHEADSAESLQRVSQRQLSGREYVIQFCGSRLTDGDFTDAGNAFVKQYYIKRYFSDYCQAFESTHETIYHLADNWENADKIASVLDQRFEKWNHR